MGVKRKILIGLAVLVGLLLVSFATQTPQALWSSEPGQAATLAVLKIVNPPARGAETRVGEAMPELTLTGLDGSAAVLQAEPGGKLLVNFWATWCGPCIVEMPVLDASAKGEVGRKVRIVGVATDQTLEVVRAHLAERPVSYPVLWSPQGPTSAQARLGGTAGPALPYSVLVGEDGRIEKTRLASFMPGELEAWVQ